MALFGFLKKRAKEVALATALAAIAAGAYAGSEAVVDALMSKKTKKIEERTARAEKQLTDIQHAQEEADDILTLLQRRDMSLRAAEEAEKQGDLASALKHYGAARTDTATALSRLQGIQIEKLIAAEEELERKLASDPEAPQEGVLAAQNTKESLQRVRSEIQRLLTELAKTLERLEEKLNDLRIRAAFKKK